jgi:hypothetical protein
MLARCVIGGPHSVHRTGNGSLDRRHGQTARSGRLKFRGVRHPLVYPEDVGYVLCRIAYRERVFGTRPNAPNSKCRVRRASAGGRRNTSRNLLPTQSNCPVSRLIRTYGIKTFAKAVLVSVVMILRLHVFLYLIDEPIYVLYVGLIAVAACFTALRLSRRSANRRLALIGCSLALLGCLIFLCIKVSERWLWPLPPWQVYSFLVGAFCLALGGVVLFVGLLQPIYEIC